MAAFRFSHVPDAVLRAARIPRRLAGGVLPLLDDRDRELEDYLSRVGAAGGSSVAYFNNPDGLLDGGYMRWFQRYTLGDTSWFVFPGDDGLGDTADESFIQIVKPGIITATVYLSAGLAFDSNISLGSNGVAGTGPNARALSFPAAGIFDAAGIASTYQAVRVFTAGTSPVYGNLSLTFHPGEPVVTLY